MGAAFRRPDTRGPTSCGKLRTPIRIDVLLGHEPAGQQRVVALVEIARIGTDFVADACDRRGIERAHITARRAGPARLHGLRPSLLERGIVHEGVRPGVEDVVAERGGLGRVARHTA